MTRPCLTIPLVPLGIIATWAAAAALLAWATFDRPEAALLGMWAIATVAGAATMSVAYLIAAQCDLIRRAFDLGRATAQPVEPAPEPIPIRR